MLMSATIPNTVVTHRSSPTIWSRGGGSWRRLVWKELRESLILWLVFVAAAVALIAFGHPYWLMQVGDLLFPILDWHELALVFAAVSGVRLFAREDERGTWEFLRSANASAAEVWGSKLLVGLAEATSIWLLCHLALLVHVYLPREVPLQAPDWETLLELLCVWLVFLVSAQLSLCSRRVAWALVPALLLWWPLAYSVVVLTPYSRTELSVVALFVLIVALGQAQVWQVRGKLLDNAEADHARRWWKAFWRVAWKELLAARDFWLAVVGFVVLFDGLGWWVFRHQETRDAAWITMSIVLPLLHSLGCGAIAFAIEREDGTQDWLRRVSAPASALFAAKLLVSQTSIVTLSTLVLFGTQQLVSSETLLSMVAIAFVMLGVTLNGVVSLGASMLTRRVLPAMFLAFVAVAAIDVPLMWVGFGAVDRGRPLVGSATAILPLWLLLVAALVAFGSWYSERWLNERRWWQELWRGDPAPPKRPPMRLQVERLPPSSSPELREFGRLVWREWMEARPWLWCLPLVFAPWLMEASSDSFHSQFGAWRWQTAVMAFVIPVLATLSLVCGLLPTLWGVWAFHHDQRQELWRFLSGRGISPTRIWLSKQAVWLPQVLLLAVLTGGLTGLYMAAWNRPEAGLVVGFAFVGALQGYAAGQWLSQLIRSPLTSMFAASLLSLLLAGWSKLLWDVHAPWVYQLAPAATLLFASWIHSRDWLEERTSWVAWLKVVAAVLLPAIDVVVALEIQGYPLWQTLRDWPMFR
jgi:hypothetical protein